MRNILLITTVTLLGGIGLHAQNYGYAPYRYDPYYRGPMYSEQYGSPGGLELYNQVQADLDRAAFDVYGSRRNINHARKEVSDVQRQLSRGRFDRDEMGEAASAIEHVLERDRLPDADRSILWRDMEQMRRFRDGRYENPGRRQY